MIDSVYTKDENYYPKVFLEKFIHNFSWRNMRNFGRWSFGSSSWNIRTFLRLGLECFISQNMRHFFRVFFFFFWRSESYLLKYKKFFRVSVPWNVKIFLEGTLFYFSSWGLKRMPGSCILYYSKWRRKRIWVQNWLLKFEEESAYENILEKLRLQDAQYYRNYLTMNTATIEVRKHLLKF